MLKDRLRNVLIDQAQAANLITYKCLVDRLELIPPQTIRRITEALEVLMAEDVAAGRPLLAALCVSRLKPSLPAVGFFMTAQTLGIFTGELESIEASIFHAHELKRTLEFYGRS